MTTSPVENSHNDIRYWFISDPSALGSVGNFNTPKRLAAVVSEDLTEDGRNFDGPVFEGGKIDAVFALLEEEQGEKIFGYIAAKLAGRKTVAAMLEDDNGGFVALWALSEGKVALLAGDRDSATVQELWDEACRLAKVPSYEEGRVYTSPRFTADKIHALGGDLSEAAKAIGLATPKQRPRLG